jgi:hypothetical protein
MANPTLDAPTDVPRIDLTANDAFGGEHPWDQYAWLRANAPVYWHDEVDGTGFWASRATPTSA